MPENVEVPAKPKSNPASHPAAIAVAIVSTIGLAVSLGLFFTGEMPLGDVIFYVLVALLCGGSACGHIFDNAIDQERPKKSEKAFSEADKE